jgi:hypothetical protein
VTSQPADTPPRRLDLPAAQAAVITLAGLALLAPLEYDFGTWLGLDPRLAWTLTVVIEGFASLTITLGRLVPLALTLTTGSALVGMLHAAMAHASAVGEARADPVRLGSAGALTALVVTALAGTHHVLKARRAAAHAAVDADRARAAQDLADADRRAQEAEDAEATRVQAALDAQHRRALEAERARSWAVQEQERAAARERAEQRAHELALTEARERAQVERASAPAPRPERAQGARPAAPDDIKARRARTQWERAQDRADAGEDDARPMTGAQLGKLLGVTEGAARKIAQGWREERAERGRQAGGVTAR